MDNQDAERFDYARERLELLRERWEAAGRPFTAIGSHGTGVEHALHKVMRLQEILVDRLAARARPGRVGCGPGLPAPREERRLRRVARLATAARVADMDAEQLEQTDQDQDCGKHDEPHHRDVVPETAVLNDPIPEAC
jgi:hypothetical protein